MFCYVYLFLFVTQSVLTMATREHRNERTRQAENAGTRQQENAETQGRGNKARREEKTKQREHEGKKEQTTALTSRPGWSHWSHWSWLGSNWDYEYREKIKQRKLSQWYDNSYWSKWQRSCTMNSLVVSK